MIRTIQNNYYWVILVCCCALTGLTYGIEGGTGGLFFKPISTELNTSVSSISLYVTIKGISMVLFTPFANRILKRYSLNIVLGLASLVYATVLFLMSQSKDTMMIYCLAIALGAAASFLSTIIVPSLIGKWFRKKQGLFLGIAFGFSGLTGSSVGPIISKVINEYGWRMGYKTISFIVLFILVPICFILVKNEPSEHYRAFDSPGTKINSRQVNIVTNEKVLKKYFMSKSFIYSFVFGISLALSNGILFNLPTYVASIGMDINIGAFATSLALLGATIFKVGFGYLNDKIKPTTVVLIASIIGAVSLLMIYYLRTNQVYLLCGSFLYGSIISLMTLEPPIIIKHIFGENYYHDIFVFVNMATQLVYSIGPTLYAGIFDTFSTYGYSFLLSIVFTLLSYPLCYLSVTNSKHLKLGE